MHPKYDTAIEFLRSNKVAVISTVSAESIPQASTVYYHLHDDHTLYFLTKENTRKAQNLKQNNQIAIVVGTIDFPVSVQILGEGSVIADLSDKLDIVNFITRLATETENSFPAIDSLDAGDFVLIKVQFKWVQLYDARVPDQGSDHFHRVLE